MNNGEMQRKALRLVMTANELTQDLHKNLEAGLSPYYARKAKEAVDALLEAEKKVSIIFELPESIKGE